MCRKPTAVEQCVLLISSQIKVVSKETHIEPIHDSYMECKCCVLLAIIFAALRLLSITQFLPKFFRNISVFNKPDSNNIAGLKYVVAVNLSSYNSEMRQCVLLEWLFRDTFRNI